LIRLRPGRAGFLSLAVPALLAGCSEDILNPGGETAVTGTVLVDRGVDPNQAPVVSLGVGIAYTTVSGAPGAGVLAAAQADGVTLDLPFPNPLTIPEQTPMTVVVHSDAPRPGRVEVWAISRDFSSAVAVLDIDGLVAGENRFTWNGKETGSALSVPNGVYTVRVTLTGTGAPAPLEQPMIVNRAVTDAIVLDAFNAYTDGSGRFGIYDVAVGTTFTRTGSNGSVLGSGRLSDRVIVFIDDVDYQHKELVVDVGVGDLVDLNVPVIPRSPLKPLLAGRTGLGTFTGPGAAVTWTQ